ncbi:MAG: hypothetical protein PHC41_06225 [Lachnospiraceae bacterium]|nr:hypothetical protein [Lachnospiraceae bacterium]MDD3615808.1 hypothetical protein [Lachnospiraceae bacterium]
MNKRLMETMQDIARNTGLAVDMHSETLFGVKNGYEVCLSQLNQTVMLNMSFSVSRGGIHPSVAEIKPVLKESKILGVCNVIGNKLNITVKNGLHKNKGVANVAEALEVVTRYLHVNGYENCCQTCGKVENTDAYIVSGGIALLCPDCFASMSSAVDLKNQETSQKKENVVAGIVGALLGSLVGAIAIVILGQLGYVAALSGVVMGICALKGYELLAGKLSRKGIVISVIIMLIMVFVGHRVDWAITVASYFEVDFFTAFNGITQLIQEQYIEAGSYYTGLVMVYLFAVAGAVPTIINSVKSKKMENVTYMMRGGNLDF